MKSKKLENLRRKIIEDCSIKDWRDVWFYPEYRGVKGWMGTQDIIFVGSNPSYNVFPTKYTDFFYKQLKVNGFDKAHLTDLIKIRSTNTDAEKIIQDNLKSQTEYLQEELEIVKPKLIVVMGNRCQQFFEKLDCKEYISITHYSAIRFPKNKEKFIKEMKDIRKRYLAQSERYSRASKSKRSNSSGDRYFAGRLKPETRRPSKNYPDRFIWRST